MSIEPNDDLSVVITPAEKGGYLVSINEGDHRLFVVRHKKKNRFRYGYSPTVSQVFDDYKSACKAGDKALKAERKERAGVEAERLRREKARTEKRRK